MTTMKNNILTTQLTFEEMTLEDIINELENMLESNIFLEEIVYNILKNSSMSDKDIASLFNYSISNRLKNLIFVLKNLL